MKGRGCLRRALATGAWVAVFGPAVASAAPTSESVSQAIVWRAPSQGCPAQTDVVREIENHLHRPLVAADVGELRAEARVSLQTDVWVADHQLSKPGVEERDQWTADACETLASVFALKVAMAIDAVTVLELGLDEPPPAEVTPQSPAEATPAPVISPPTPTDEASEPASPRTLRGAVRVMAGAGIGLLPSVAPELHGAVALFGEKWRVELNVRHSFQRQLRLDDEPGVGGDFRLTTGGARGCPVPRVGPIEIPLCVGLDVGALWGQGVGVSQTVATRRAWLAIAVGPALRWTLGRYIALHGGADAYIVLLRPGFAFETRGRLFRAPPAAVSVAGGVEVRFP